ncbi:C39 family peptidase [Spirochaeta cellobiosiphila]|uniref:C39 family peptidase n=1 Tax=Spirochaeta cellobiosiphila TaxID=504483 RepID=UPI000429479D|nr:C39 family peptidase [Spirochaeta cellobiosiphila]
MDFSTTKGASLKDKILLSDIPFYSQWISSELVGDIVTGSFDPINDPLWQLSGADTPADYDFWAKNICGMACLKMVLDYWQIDSDPLIPMAKECASYGGYKIQADHVDGLYYVPFTQYVQERFQISSHSLSPLSTEQIVEETLKGNLLITSVHCTIREASPTYEGSRGGHLVLITGVDTSQQCFYINNPSGISVETQRNFKIPFDIFERYFAGRGILLCCT